MSIKDLERDLVKAERRANAPFIDDRERERREQDVARIERDLEFAYAAAEGELAGRGRRSRW